MHNVLDKILYLVFMPSMFLYFYIIYTMCIAHVYLCASNGYIFLYFYLLLSIIIKNLVVY